MRWRPSKKAMQETNWGVFLTLSLILFVLVNYFSYRYYQRWDLTASKSFSLSDQSTKVLQSLEGDLNVVVFLAPMDDLMERVRDLLSAYQSVSPRVKVEYIDPDRQLDRMQLLAARYGVTQANVVVFEAEGRSKYVEKDQMVEYDFSAMRMGGPPRLTAFKGEEAFTNAVLEILEPNKHVVYFSSGHGELSDLGPGEGLTVIKGRLEGEGAELRIWQSLGKDSVPEDADLLVVAGPTKPFTDDEAEVIGRYLEGGGKALFLMYPVPAEGPVLDLLPTGLEAILSRWGITPRRDLVVDVQGSVPNLGAQTFFALGFGTHEIVEDLDRNQLPVILSLATSLEVSEAPEGYAVSMLLETSPGGWGETNLVDLDDVKPDPEDSAGPLVLAAAVSSEDEERQTQIVVAGDVQLAADQIVGERFGNLLFCLNAIHWLLAQENRLAIPPKTAMETRVELTATQSQFIFLLLVIFLPGLVAGTGVWVYLKRRR